jgi:hypothetical protein
VHVRLRCSQCSGTHILTWPVTDEDPRPRWHGPDPDEVGFGLLAIGVFTIVLALVLLVSLKLLPIPSAVRLVVPEHQWPAVTTTWSTVNQAGGSIILALVGAGTLLCGVGLARRLWVQSAHTRYERRLRSWDARAKSLPQRSLCDHCGHAWEWMPSGAGRAP